MRELDGAIPEEELDDIVDEIDADGSGTVDFEGMYITFYTYNYFFFDSHNYAYKIFYEMPSK